MQRTASVSLSMKYVLIPLLFFNRWVLGVLSTSHVLLTMTVWKNIFQDCKERGQFMYLPLCAFIPRKKINNNDPSSSKSVILASAFSQDSGGKNWRISLGSGRSSDSFVLSFLSFSFSFPSSRSSIIIFVVVTVNSHPNICFH